MVVLLLSLLPEMTGPHNRKNGVLSVGMVHCLDTNVNFFKKGNICGRQEQFCRSRKIVVIHWRTLLCVTLLKWKETRTYFFTADCLVASCCQDAFCSKISLFSVYIRARTDDLKVCRNTFPFFWRALPFWHTIPKILY